MLICRYNVPIAELSPVTPAKRSDTSPELSGIGFVAPPEESTEAEWDDA